MKIVASASLYFHTISRLISRPGDFFSKIRHESMINPALYLFISIIFFIMASLTLVQKYHFSIMGVLFLNAALMPLIMSTVSLLIIKMIVGKHVPFANFFFVNAFASGTTILISWIPLFLWISEPWKWALIVIGYVKACGLNYRQALLVMIISVILIMLGFQFFLSVVSTVNSGY